MKKIVLLAVASSFITTVTFADCASLMAQYNAPDPSIKTMRQVKRWVKRKVKDSNKEALEKCLVDRAADNPNRATVAGQ